MLGVDPGTVVTGWGVVEERVRAVCHVASGVIRLRGSRAERLGMLRHAVDQLCTQFAPEAIVVEQSFVGDNIQSAFRLGEARGAVMVAAAERRLPVAEYSPAEIKSAVTGSGRAAKSQVLAMVGRVLGHTAPMVADEADALAAAICHLHAHRLAQLTAASQAFGAHPRLGRRRTVGRR